MSKMPPFFGSPLIGLSAMWGLLAHVAPGLWKNSPDSSFLL